MKKLRKRRPVRPDDDSFRESSIIEFFHDETPLVVKPYRIPDDLWMYYCYRQSKKKKTQFEKEVYEFINSGIDQYNEDFMNNRINSLCDNALADLAKDHIVKQRVINLISVKKKASIKALDLKIQALTKIIAVQESELDSEEK